MNPYNFAFNAPYYGYNPYPVFYDSGNLCSYIPFTPIEQNPAPVKEEEKRTEYREID